MAGKRKPRKYEIEIVHAKNGKTLEEALWSCSDIIMRVITKRLSWEKEQEDKLLLNQIITK